MIVTSIALLTPTTPEIAAEHTAHRLASSRHQRTHQLRTMSLFTDSSDDLSPLRTAPPPRAADECGGGSRGSQSKGLGKSRAVCDQSAVMMRDLRGWALLVARGVEAAGSLWRL
jgi:hypothetical protein